MTRRKFTSKFKIKVILEVLKERSAVQELAQKASSILIDLKDRVQLLNFTFNEP